MRLTIRSDKKLISISVFILLTFFSRLNATSYTNVGNGDWNNPLTWGNASTPLPTSFDNVTIAAGTTVTVTSTPTLTYFWCENLTINGTLVVGATNLTVGGGNLAIDVNAVRNSECIINGTLQYNGDYDTQLKIYGNVKFNTGSTFNMTAGQLMVDGSGFTEALSVTANKALLDVTDATNFSTTGGHVIIWSPHFHATGLTIKGAKHFRAISFGNNLTLADFACRNPNDFIISDTDKPTFGFVQLAYLPNSTRQNQVVLNNLSVSNLSLSNGVLAGSGSIKVSENVLISPLGRIERDVEFNGVGEQRIGSSTGETTPMVIKGNIIVNTAGSVVNQLNLEVQNGTVNFMQGRFDLTNKTLTLNSAPLNGNASRYFVSHNYLFNTGTLLIKNVGANTFFPVGTHNDYLPITLSAANGDFSVSVQPLSNSTWSGAGYVLNRQWDIKRVTGTAAAEIKFQWNMSNEEVVNFIDYRQNCRVFHNSGSMWLPLNSTPGAVAQTTNIFTKIQQNVSQFSLFTIQTQTILAVNLKNFTGISNPSGAALKWTTLSEKDNAGFTVEKSQNGFEFTPLTFVKAKDKGNGPQSYDFLDKEFSETAYYRLKIEGIDGVFTYSPIIFVQDNTQKSALTIYPNPVGNASFLSVNISGQSKNTWDLTIQSMSGQVVFQKLNTKLEDLQTIPVDDFAKGMYFVRLNNGRENLVGKFVK
jgi:hypothetical protein